MAALLLRQTTRFSFRRHAAPWVLAALCLCSSESVWAQSASEKAAAESLFDQGVDLLKKGEVAAACKKLEKSQSVDPGIGTLLYLGECYKQLGRTASAWATFREASSKAQAAGETERAAAGSTRADALEPELSFVSFEVAAETSALAGLKVVQGGSEVSPALFGTKVPVDPGDLKVVATAPGYESFEIAIKIQKGPAETTISIPALPALPASETEPEEPKEGEASETDEHNKAPGKTQRAVGIALGAVGALGLGVGTAFGILAINADKDADAVCDDTTCDPGSNGYDDSKTAITYGNVSTIAIAAGAALAVGGVVLYLTAPKRQTTGLLVLPRMGGAQLSFGGSF